MSFNLNYKPNTASEFVRGLITLAVAAGGTAQDYSDGSTVSSGAPPANNTLDGADRWARFKMPYTTHEFCIQLYTASTNGGENNVRVTVSPGGFNNDGTANTTPTASDQQTLCGGGTNGAPSYSGGLPNKGTSIYQMFVSSDNTKIGFWVKIYPIGGGETSVVWMMDPVIPQLGVLDLDPYVYWVQESGATLRNGASYEHGSACPWTYVDYSGGGQSFLRAPACYLSAGGFGRINGGFNPQTGKLDSYFVFYCTGNMPKGVSKYHEFNYKTGLVNATGVNVGMSNLVKCTFGDTCCNWDGATTPAIV